ncbi:MAG TPA: class I SAM-dependent methyltransferase [Desulfobacterales bacterium]|nr:class I SAM-dependent methyltransferase [Desulfobacterales bacterium]
MIKIWKRILREIVRYFSGAIHIFGKYSCSVCKKKVISFRPLPRFYFDNFKKYGYKIGPAETCNREQYSCPHCGAADRDRLYAIYLRQFISKKLSSKKTSFNTLDLAPTKGLSSFIISEFSGLPYFHYRTADLHADGVNDKVDISDMTIYNDYYFDLFICSHMLEHVEDDRQALRELYRILKNGGQGILMVPIDLSLKEIDENPDCSDVAERWRRFGQGDHVRKYSKQGFIDRIIEAGFELEQLGVEEFGIQQFVKHGITQQSVLYIVKKP